MDTDLEMQPVAAPAARLADSADNSTQLSKCKFGWKDVSYTVDTKTGKKQILHDVSGCVEKGILLIFLQY